MARKKPTIDELEKILEPDARKRIADMRARIARDADLIKSMDRQIVEFDARVRKAEEENRALRDQSKVMSGEVRLDGAEEFIRGVMENRFSNVPSLGTASSMPTNATDALEAAKQGILPRWAPEYRVDPALHALSEVVRLHSRLDQHEQFLKYLVRAASSGR